MLSSKAFLKSGGPQPHLVLIILNYALPKSTPFFWRRATMRICADGGANRVFDSAATWTLNKEPLAARRQFLPDAIAGDLDSIRPDVADFYTQQGIQIQDLSHDQDRTDLDKCIVCAEQYLSSSAIPMEEATILAVGAFGGRLDHTLSNINSLYTHQHLPLVLCGEDSLARLIPAGRTSIQPEAELEGPECGVIGLSQPAHASSTGLQWNLDGHVLAMGGVMSSSNKMVDEEVCIETDVPLLWTTQFKDNVLI